MPSAEPMERQPLELAERWAEKIRATLAPLCSRLEVAGSIRRRRPFVGDIDLVCVPLGEPGGRGTKTLLDRCAVTGEQVKRGEQYAVFTLANGFQLDLWLAHDEHTRPSEDLLNPEPVRVPGNFGAVLLSRTGSAAFNIWFAQKCQAEALHFHPHQGVFRGRSLIASAEERDLFAAVGSDFIPPESRER